ncbi:hypothetical protein ACLKA6_003101 [Drosophila palustris]
MVSVSWGYRVQPRHRRYRAGASRSSSPRTVAPSVILTAPGGKASLVQAAGRLSRSDRSQSPVAQATLRVDTAPEQKRTRWEKPATSPGNKIDYTRARIVADVRIEGLARQATIDTGATRSFISESTASQINKGDLREVRARVSMADGSSTTESAIGVDDASTTHAKITGGAGATRAATEMITSGLEQITSWGPLEDGEPSQRPHPFGGTTDGIHDLPAKQQKHRKDHPFGGTTDGIHDLPAKQQKHREDHPFGGTTDEVHDLPATSTTMAEVQDPNTGTHRNEYQDPSGGTSKPRMIATNGLDNAPMTITQANNQEAKTGQEMEPHVNEAEDDDESKPRTKQAEEPGLEPWVRKFLESELAQF